MATLLLHCMGARFKKKKKKHRNKIKKFIFAREACNKNKFSFINQVRVLK